MRRSRSLGAEVFLRFDDADAEQSGPDAIGGNARRQRIFAGAEPLRDAEPIQRRSRRQRREGFGHASIHHLARIQKIAAVVLARLAAFGLGQFAQDRRGRRFDGGQFGFQLCKVVALRSQFRRNRGEIVPDLLLLRDGALRRRFLHEIDHILRDAERRLRGTFVSGRDTEFAEAEARRGIFKLVVEDHLQLAAGGDRLRLVSREDRHVRLGQAGRDGPAVMLRIGIVQGVIDRIFLLRKIGGGFGQGNRRFRAISRADCQGDAGEDEIAVVLRPADAALRIGGVGQGFDTDGGDVRQRGCEGERVRFLRRPFALGEDGAIGVQRKPRAAGGLHLRRVRDHPFPRPAHLLFPGELRPRVVDRAHAAFSRWRQFRRQLGTPGRFLGRRRGKRRRFVAQVGVLRLIEKGVEPIIFPRGDRIVFVRVALGTPHRQPHPHLHRRIDAVLHGSNSIFFPVDASFLIGQRIAMKSSRDTLAGGGVRQQVAG